MNSWDEPQYICECIGERLKHYYSVFKVPANLDGAYYREGWGLAIPQTEARQWVVCDQCKGRVIS